MYSQSSIHFQQHRQYQHPRKPTTLLLMIFANFIKVSLVGMLMKQGWSTGMRQGLALKTLRTNLENLKSLARLKMRLLTKSGNSIKMCLDVKLIKQGWSTGMRLVLTCKTLRTSLESRKSLVNLKMHLLTRLNRCIRICLGARLMKQGWSTGMRLVLTYKTYARNLLNLKKVKILV